MSTLFKAPTTGGGSKYENIEDGLYRGTLLRLEEGPTFYDTKEISDEFPQGKPQPKVRWTWALSDISGKPMNEEISELTSTAVGDRSTAARFFTAHLSRPFDAKVISVEDAESESIGKSVLLSVSTKPSGYRRIDVFPATK